MRTARLFVLSSLVLGTSCSSDDTPKPPSPVPCSNDAACTAAFTDLGLCERAACQHGACARAAVLDGTTCDDGSLCTAGETCYAGLCEPLSTVTCDTSADTACRRAQCVPA